VWRSVLEIKIVGLKLIRLGKLASKSSRLSNLIENPIICNTRSETIVSKPSILSQTVSNNLAAAVL